MAIMITARHLQLREKEPFTFEMCFHELCHFVRRVQRELVSGASESASHSIVAISSINVLAERFYVMQAFHRLLELELLLPESARASLVLPCGVATRTGTERCRNLLSFPSFCLSVLKSRPRQFSTAP